MFKPMLFEDINEYWFQNPGLCVECIRYNTFSRMEPYLRLDLNLFTILVSGILYFKCGKVLMQSKHITRKGMAF